MPTLIEWFIKKNLFDIYTMLDAEVDRIRHKNPWEIFKLQIFLQRKMR